MKKLLFAVIAALCLSSFSFSQDAKPAPTPTKVEEKKPAAGLSEVETLKVQLQLSLQANAALRKQVAQEQAQKAALQKQVSDLNVQTEEANEKAIQTDGGLLLQQLANAHDVKLSEADLSVDLPMKFVPKPTPAVSPNPKP
jgi:hypothetical protein